jgi:hypothetical protein
MKRRLGTISAKEKAGIVKTWARPGESTSPSVPALGDAQTMLSDQWHALTFHLLFRACPP